MTDPTDPTDPNDSGVLKFPDLEPGEAEILDDTTPPGDPDAPPVHVFDVTNPFELRAVHEATGAMAKAVMEASDNLKAVASQLAAAHGVHVDPETEIAVLIAPNAATAAPRVAVYRFADLAAKEERFAGLRDKLSST